MRNVIKLSIILLLSISFFSCEKEPITDIAKIEKELKTVIKDKGFTKCSIIVMYGETTYTEHSDVKFTINGGFVIVKAYVNNTPYEERYNLLYLSKYMIGTDNKLALYFANTHY